MKRAAPRFEKRTCAALALLAIAGCPTSIGGCGRIEERASGEDDSGIGSVVDAAPGAPDATVGSPDAAVGPPDAAVPPDARPPCVEGDDRVEDPDTGACYIFFQASLAWDDAEAACLALGGHLVAPTSLVENELVSGIVPDSEDVWIGASDQASEGSFTWATGEAFVFDNWRSGVPNDSNGGEDCAVAEGDNNIPGRGCLWDDRDCGSSFPYLCERS